MPLIQSVNAEDIVKAIGIANELREYRTFRDRILGRNKVEPIDDLPAGIRSNSQQCVLALAFNFGCSVDRNPLVKPGAWFVYFPKSRRAHAKKMAEIVGTMAIAHQYRHDWKWIVELPTDIANIALQFDHANLPEKYYVSCT